MDLLEYKRKGGLEGEGKRIATLCLQAREVYALANVMGDRERAGQAETLIHKLHSRIHMIQKVVMDNIRHHAEMLDAQAQYRKNRSTWD